MKHILIVEDETALAEAVAARAAEAAGAAAPAYRNPRRSCWTRWTRR